MGRKNNPPGFAVESGSELAGDDALTHPFHVSLAVSVGLNAAVDHLHAFYGLLWCTGLPPRECPRDRPARSLGDGVQRGLDRRPDDRAERVHRALRWFGKDAKDGKSAMNGGGPVEMFEQRQAKLEAIATAGRDGVRGVVRAGPGRHGRCDGGPERARPRPRTGAVRGRAHPAVRRAWARGPDGGRGNTTAGCQGARCTRRRVSMSEVDCADVRTRLHAR